MLSAQVGDASPDVSPADLASMWEVTQTLLQERTISAGHDISDGGIAVALAEMAFAGNLGIKVSSLQKSTQPGRIVNRYGGWLDASYSNHTQFML